MNCLLLTLIERPVNNFDLAKSLFVEGLRHIQNEEYESAEYKLRASLKLLPQRMSTLTNLSAVLIKLKKYSEAESTIANIVAIDEAIAEAWLNYGLIEKEKNRNHLKAIEYFDRALDINPSYPEAWLNRGAALIDLKCYQEAIDSYNKAIAVKADFAAAYSNLGNALLDIKQHQTAIENYDVALALQPNIEYLEGMRLHTKMHICDWSDIGNQMSRLAISIECNEKAAPPFAILSILTSPAAQRKVAEIFARDKCSDIFPFSPISKPDKKGKLRIGYYSADYHNHATSYLMAELFEKHDRSKFEIIAFSFGPNKIDEMRKRVEAAFDMFIDVKTQSDMDVALLSRNLGIDIAVDLKGFTQDSRPGIFAARAAPVQVNYLGYPGTMGAEYIDYLIADPTLILETSKQHYCEKIAYLPNSYQVNDAKRRIADKVFTRKEAGLPETGFVFCCFNNNYKITPSTFDGWMRILQKVERSVLWLFEDNPIAAGNLRKEAIQRGVDAERLIFAKRMPLPEHLARHRLADLFLDTLPYNAHTTASDALWVGLPVLTCAGEAFASRVAASLLNAIHMPELVTTTQEEYEAQAVELASSPDKLMRIKQKLAANRLATPLFDSQLFTKHIEAAYMQMYERYYADLAPDHIYVKTVLI